MDTLIALTYLLTYLQSPKGDSAMALAEFSLSIVTVVVVLMFSVVP